MRHLLRRVAGSDDDSGHIELPQFRVRFGGREAARDHALFIGRSWIVYAGRFAAVELPAEARGSGPLRSTSCERPAPASPRRSRSRPRAPPSGPRSMTQSAHLTTSRLCSMTTTVLPGVDEARQHAEELVDVLEVEARRRLVEHVERPPGLHLAELAARASRAAPRRRSASAPAARSSCSRGRPRLSVSQDARELPGSALKSSRHSSTLDSSTSAIDLPLKRTSSVCGVVALAAADLAGDVDVGEEVHLDLDHAVAAARLAAAALDVEAEAAGVPAARARVGELREDVADRVERLGVRARGSSAACGRWASDRWRSTLSSASSPSMRVVRADADPPRRGGAARGPGAGCRSRASSCPRRSRR